MYALLTPSQVLGYSRHIEMSGVSQVARAPGGFMYKYVREGEKMLDRVITPSTGLTWAKKREAFIKRHLVQYKANPTLRRRLALIAWAYDPK